MAVAELIEAAKEANSAHEYVVADAADPSFEDGRLSLVVAYNMLMDVEDVPATLEGKSGVSCGQTAN